MSTRNEFADLGGRAVPIRYAFEVFPDLREKNDVYHRQDRGWTNLIARRTGDQAIRFASNQDEPRADFLIVAPVFDQWESLLRRLPNPEENEDSGLAYARSTVPFQRADGPPGSYLVIVARPSQTLNTVATLTTGAIQRFRPWCLIVFGAGGGVTKNGVQLGDVVVASAMVDHEISAAEVRGIQILPRFIGTDPDLVTAARQIGLEKVQLTATRPGSGAPVLRVGIAASLDFSEGRQQYFRSLLECYPQLLGVQSEAGGVALAGFQSAYQPRLLMIQAITQYADSGRTSDGPLWRKYACDISSAYTMAFLQSGAFVRPIESGPLLPADSPPASPPAMSGMATQTPLPVPALLIPERQELTDRKSVLFLDNWKKFGVKVREISVTKVLSEDGSSTLRYRIEDLKIRTGEIAGLRFVLQSAVGYLSRPKNDDDADSLNIRWEYDSNDRLKDLPVEPKLDELRRLTGVFQFSLSSEDPGISFGWTIEVFNGDAMSDWEYRNLYHRKGQKHVDDSFLNGPTEYFARLAWLPAETLKLRLQLPERIVARPFLTVFGYAGVDSVPTSEFLRDSIVQTYPTPGSDWALPKKWRRDLRLQLAEAPRLCEPEPKIAEVIIDKPLTGTYYSLDWKLPKSELDARFQHLISVAGNLRKKLLAHRKRRLKDQDKGADAATTLVRQLFARFDAAVRKEFASDENERFETALFTYDDESHRLVPVEGLATGL